MIHFSVSIEFLLASLFSGLAKKLDAERLEQLINVGVLKQLCILCLGNLQVD